MDEGKLTWEKATDLTATCTTIYHSQTEIPASIKREACQSVLLMERAKEEVVMVKEEMTNTVMHYIKKHEELSSTIDSITPSVASLHTRGVLTVLHTNLYQTEHHLLKLISVFEIDVELKQQVTSPCYQRYQFLNHGSEELDEILSSIREADKINESVDESEEELEEDSDDDDDVMFSRMINYRLPSSKPDKVSTVTLPVLADSTTLIPAVAVDLPMPANASNKVEIFHYPFNIMVINVYNFCMQHNYDDELAKVDRPDEDVRSNCWRDTDMMLETEQGFLEHVQQVY